MAKANSAAPLDAALVQDLRVGEGQAVEIGDFLEVSYTGWLMHSHVIGQVVQISSCVATGSCRHLHLEKHLYSHLLIFKIIVGL